MFHKWLLCPLCYYLLCSGELVWKRDGLKSWFCYSAGQMARHLFCISCFSNIFLAMIFSYQLKILWVFCIASGCVARLSIPTGSSFVLCNYWSQVYCATYLLFQMLQQKCYIKWSLMVTPVEAHLQMPFLLKTLLSNVALCL